MNFWSARLEYELVGILFTYGFDVVKIAINDLTKEKAEIAEYEAEQAQKKADEEAYKSAQATSLSRESRAS